MNIRTVCVLASAASLLLVGGLTSCSPRVDNRGHVATSLRLSSVTTGVSTRQDVFNALGSPSTTSAFGAEEWYYISVRKETVAFLESDIEKQQVVRITFDQQGVVSAIDHYNKKDGENLAVAEERTPTAGHSLGFFEQVFGNIGRFNKGADSGPRTYGSQNRPRR